MEVSQIFKKGKGWRSDPKKSGGGVVNIQATHLLDLITWFFGFPEKVQAFSNNYYSKSLEDFCRMWIKNSTLQILQSGYK